MSYFNENKEAWEEAFEHRHPGWGEANYQRLANEELPFFCPDVAEEFRRIDFSGKDIAQFCCNNGRELLSLMGLGAKSGVGFDIAENIIAQAIDTAEKAGIKNCKFVPCLVSLSLTSILSIRSHILIFKKNRGWSMRGWDICPNNMPQKPLPAFRTPCRTL